MAVAEILINACYGDGSVDSAISDAIKAVFSTCCSFNTPLENLVLSSDYFAHSIKSLHIFPRVFQAFSNNKDVKYYKTLLTMDIIG